VYYQFRRQICFCHKSVNKYRASARPPGSQWLQSQRAVIPPSTTISVPVMKRASSEARNNAAFAVSRPSPSIPSGMRFWRCLSSFDVAARSLSRQARFARRGAADDVDEHVDSVPFVHAGPHHRGDSFAAGHIAQMRFDGAARLLHPLDRLAQPLGVAVHRKDLRAFFGEAHRGRAPVAPARPHRARSGDDRDLVLQAFRHGLRASFRGKR